MKGEAMNIKRWFKKEKKEIELSWGAAHDTHPTPRTKMCSNCVKSTKRSLWGDYGCDSETCWAPINNEWEGIKKPFMENMKIKLKHLIIITGTIAFVFMYLLYKII